MQRSINLALGTALSRISLTIRAVLSIGFFTGETMILGLDPPGMVLPLPTLVVSMPTFALERTNILLGAVHLLLFLAYLMLIFQMVGGSPRDPFATLAGVVLDVAIPR